jgi:predicted GNAT family N-acyltransferase/DNA-binding MarR family transcriptional regulator
MNAINQAGLLALGTHLQHLTERLRKEAALFYKSLHIKFEPKWFPAIYVLSVNSSLSVSELAQEIGLTHPTTISLLKELELNGLVLSIKDAEDERRRMVSLTGKSKELIKTMQPAWTAMNEALYYLTDNPNNLIKAIAEVNAKLDEKSFLMRMSEIMHAQHGTPLASETVLEVYQAKSTHELKMALAIRHEVFVKEQHVPAEFEKRNNEDSIHFLATVNDLPAGTARYRKTEDGIKLERFAVLKQYRGMKVGDALVKYILKDLPPGVRVYLNAQLEIAGLYLSNGFAREGEVFKEANIDHIKMVLPGK